MMNEKLNTRPLVIYHGNCADGFSAAWVVWKHFGAAADYHAGVYQKAPPEAEGRHVYLVDFSYKKDVILTMLKEGKVAGITILDHHKSAIEDLQELMDMGYIDGVFDTERCGAMITWDYVFPGEPRPLLLGHIDDRDRWQFKIPGTREVQANVFSYEYTFEQWDKMMNLQAVDYPAFIVAGQAIERKHFKDIKELLAVCRRDMQIGNYIVPVASLPYTMSSDAGHIMAKEAPFAACYIDTATHRVFSLRSAENGVDVSEVAKLYGGGGHKNAAGFSVPRDHPLATA